MLVVSLIMHGIGGKEKIDNYTGTWRHHM